jgi:hypothetical protein
VINVKDVLEIYETQILTKQKCIINLNLEDYDVEFEIINNPEFIQVPGVLELYFPDLDDFTQIVTQYPLKIIKNSNTLETDDEVSITFEPGDIIISQEYFEESNINLSKLLQGKVKYLKDPNLFLKTLHNSIPTIALVHFEILISTLLRDSENNPCRLTGNYKDCTINGVSSLAKNDSWLSAMSYRDIDSVISKTLVKQENIKENPIEKVLMVNMTND